MPDRYSIAMTFCVKTGSVIPPLEYLAELLTLYYIMQKEVFLFELSYIKLKTKEEFHHSRLDLTKT